MHVVDMNDSDNSDDSDGDNDFGFLFKEKNPEDSVFYFQRIDVNYSAEVCTVTYNFNFDNTIDLSCTLIVENVSNIDERTFKRMLLSIGLCALPWYWMGFASKRILVEESVRQNLFDFTLQLQRTKVSKFKSSPLLFLYGKFQCYIASFSSLSHACLAVKMLLFVCL